MAKNKYRAVTVMEFESLEDLNDVAKNIEGLLTYGSKEITKIRFETFEVEELDYVKVV